MEKIEVLGNRCFAGRQKLCIGGGDCPDCRVVQAAVKPNTARPKSERVNVVFGKIRVQVTNAKKVGVKETENTLIVSLE